MFCMILNPTSRDNKDVEECSSCRIRIQSFQGYAECATFVQLSWVDMLASGLSLDLQNACRLGPLA